MALQLEYTNPAGSACNYWKIIHSRLSNKTDCEVVLGLYISKTLSDEGKHPVEVRCLNFSMTLADLNVADMNIYKKCYELIKLEDGSGQTDIDFTSATDV